MRKIIAALQVSVDGFIEGTHGELDWAMAEDEETWRDIFEMLTHVERRIGTWRRTNKSAKLW